MSVTKEKKRSKNYGNFSSKRLRLVKNQKPMIGIDIGTSSIEIVQMAKHRIKRLGMDSIPLGMVNQGRVETVAPLAKIIRKCMDQNGIKGTTCSLCLSSNELIVRELTLPEMSETQIYENIHYEITSFLPLKHEEYCIDYKILEYLPSQDNSPGKLRLMVATAPKNLINTYITTLKKANLKVVHVDIAPNVVAKIVKLVMENNGPNSNMRNICIIDFGSHTTQVIILKDGNYFIHKSISNGGDYLTTLIADKGNMDLMNAEEYKYRTNFFNENIQNQLSMHVKNYFEYLLVDVERTIEFFNNRNNQTGINHIYIMGGGALLPGLTGYIKDHLSIEASLISNAMEPIYAGRNLDINLSYFANAIGATMREEW